MIIYVIFVLIYICVMLIIGQINLKEKEKSDFFVVSSITYNLFMGYVTIFIFKLANIYLSNMPKGVLGEYALPELEAWFNWFWGTVMILSYFSCLIPINLYMRNRVINGKRFYYKINLISLFTGILIYCLMH